MPFSITREGFAYLFILAFVLAVAILRDINLMYAVAGLMIGPFLFNAALAAAIPRGLRVRRQMPATLEAGETLTVHLSLANPQRRLAAWLVVVADTLERHRAPLRPRRVTATAWFPHVPPGSTRHSSYRGWLTERGRYRFGPLRVSCRFPLGLVRRTVTIEAPGDVVVYPRLGELTEKAKALWRQAARGDRPARRRGRAEAEFHGLRDWQRGDSRRWIHWRSTARRGEIVVREFEQQEHHDLAIVLDLAASGSPSPRQVDAIERAVSIAATLVTGACAEPAARVILAIAAEREVLLSGASSTKLRSEMLAALAEVEAARVDEPSAARKHAASRSAAFDGVSRIVRPDTPVLIVSANASDDRAAVGGVDPDRHRAANWITIDATKGGGEYVALDVRG
ncbi:MAG: hypothetical protein DCC68_17470 [Planctomycetota bacterium]|nr:MAG: hypothetical protein DCC68_17470 [Planctomycetota bacterium]